MGEVLQRGVNGIIFRADSTPAAFGLNAAHFGKHPWVQITHACTVWNLVKLIFSCDRTDLQWLEENIVPAILGHWLVLVSMWIV